MHVYCVKKSTESLFNFTGETYIEYLFFFHYYLQTGIFLDIVKTANIIKIPIQQLMIHKSISAY